MSDRSAGAVVLAPFSGTVRALEQVPDEVFAQGIVGLGVAIEPDDEEQIEVLAPVDATLVKVHPHAVVLEFTGDAARRGVLLHLGIDTVRLEGRGFTPQADQGQQVAAGELLSRWTPQPARAAGHSLISPVLALGASAEEVVLSCPPGAHVAAGQELFRWR